MNVPFTPLYINGQERAASSKASFEVRNPYSQEVVTLAASASSQDCKDAVDAAVDAFRNWEHTPHSAKRDLFLKAADILDTEHYRTKVASAMKAETSCGDFLVEFNLQVSIEMLRQIASLVTELQGETFPSSTPTGLSQELLTLVCAFTDSP